MVFSTTSALVLLGAGAAGVVSGLLPPQPEPAHEIQRRGKTNMTEPYSLPSSDSDPEGRAAAIEAKREGWLYGPSIAGNTSYYPTGDLANATTETQVEWWFAYADALLANATEDSIAAITSVTLKGGIRSVDDYAKLYDEGLWAQTVPDGPFEGMLSNYTSDLLFAMERLSTSPYSLARVGPDDELLFAVDNAESIAAGMTTEELQAAGRLFVVDYIDHRTLPKTEGKYGAACQAYFFIHPETSDFLPLAIRPNADGAPEDLVYTPLEEDPDDWLLAKMLFNINDVWYAQWYHLAATHETAEIVYLAAIRTLSEEHPLMPFIHKLMKLAWALRPAAEERLLFPTGPVDDYFPWAGSQAQAYTDALYNSGEASRWRAGYFSANLEARGLGGTNTTAGPDFKSFPFRDDASVLLRHIEGFFSALVESYYGGGDEAVASDPELRAWIAECRGPAGVHDFNVVDEEEEEGLTAPGLVGVLTHLAYLAAVQHGALNSNTPVASTASLPGHPLAFYEEIPVEKGVFGRRRKREEQEEQEEEEEEEEEEKEGKRQLLKKDPLAAMMPPLDAAAGQIALLASFNRALFEDTEETMIYMFDLGAETMGLLGPRVREAEAAFRGAMEAFAEEVGNRGFDEDGLSQGMPFIWTSLDPSKAPFWLTV